MDRSMLLEATNAGSSSPGKFFSFHIGSFSILCSFTGSAGLAIITRNSAYLFVDSRYWVQAENEVDDNWTLIRAGAPGAPQDWIEWLVVRVSVQF